MWLRLITVISLANESKMNSQIWKSGPIQIKHNTFDNNQQTQIKTRTHNRERGRENGILAATISK